MSVKEAAECRVSRVECVKSYYNLPDFSVISPFYVVKFSFFPLRVICGFARRLLPSSCYLTAYRSLLTFTCFLCVRLRGEISSVPLQIFVSFAASWHS